MDELQKTRVKTYRPQGCGLCQGRYHRDPAPCLPGRGIKFGIMLVLLGVAAWRLAIHPVRPAPANIRPGPLQVSSPVTTRKLPYTLPTHGEGAAVAYNPAGALLATAGNSGVDLWDAASYEKICTLHSIHYACSVTFSPDGQTLAIGSYNATITLWNPSTGKQRHILNGPRIAPMSHFVQPIAFSPDGRTLASGDPNGYIRLWDVATTRKRQTLVAHPANAMVVHEGSVASVVSPDTEAIAFSPDGKWLAAGSYDGTIGMWEASTGKKRRSLPPDLCLVGSLSFSPDSKMLASASGNSKLWDVSTGKLLHTFPDARVPHTYPSCEYVSFSPDGRILTAVDMSGGVQLWRNGASRWIYRPGSYPDPFCGVAFKPDGRALACGSEHAVTILAVPST